MKNERKHVFLKKKLKNFSEKTKEWSKIFLQEKNTHSEIEPYFFSTRFEIPKPAGTIKIPFPRFSNKISLSPNKISFSPHKLAFMSLSFIFA
jgi:hypothetical protein